MNGSSRQDCKADRTLQPSEDVSARMPDLSSAPDHEAAGGPHSQQSQDHKFIDPSVWRIVGNPLVPPVHDGPLHDLGVAVKDLFAVQGFAIGAGNPKFLSEARIQKNHASAVRSLLEAGAHVVGIAQTDEFAYSLSGVNIHYGAAPNPSAPGRISGGSSSGPATAVSGGQAEIGLGTDTAGSIRVPAAYQGLWGIRTSTGRIQRDGVHPLSPSFDTVGILARDAHTLAIAAEQLMPEPDRAAPAGVKTDVLLDSCVDEDVRIAFSQWRSTALRNLHTHDCEIHDSTITANSGELAITHDMLDAWLTIFNTVRGYEAWKAHGGWVSNHWNDMDPQIASRFERDMHITAEDYENFCVTFADARAEIRNLLGNHLLLIPTVSCVAPLAGDSDESIQAIAHARAETMLLTTIAGIAGLPAVNIPIRTKAGLPCGACLIGPSGSDKGVIAAAEHLAKNV
ncbi:amidase family protein [Bifidobacterium aquikefiri]|nr:amidase family protein [Bifidobacterium aquikefiri]